jgi:hypothetical protein
MSLATGDTISILIREQLKVIDWAELDKQEDAHRLFIEEHI